MCIGIFKMVFIAPKSGKKTKNSKNRHFSPIFGDKLVNWNMKSQTRHKDISCLGLHSWFYKFIAEDGARNDIFASFEGFATLWVNKKPP